MFDLRPHSVPQRWTEVASRNPEKPSLSRGEERPEVHSSGYLKTPVYATRVRSHDQAGSRLNREGYSGSSREPIGAGRERKEST